MELTALAITDEIHGILYDYFQLERWKSVDLVLSCGDLPPEYLDFVATQLNVPIFYVRGNHDGVYERSRYDGFENVHGRVAQFRGLRIAGFEGCVRYNNGPVQYSERQMNRLFRYSRLRALRSGTPDIVIAHAPPAGCHEGHDVCHRGFQCFRDAIDIWKPRFFVHGHTHRHYGRDAVSHLHETTVINAFPYHVFRIPT